MQIQVSGKHVDVGEALGSRISQELQDGIGKYFERGAQDAEVIVAKEGHSFKVDCWVRLASGQVVFTTGLGGDAHSAFTESLDKLEKRVRRYKRRLKDHHIGPKGLSPEKTEAEIRTVTVGRAVLELDMTGYPVVVFRNAAHGGLSVVYRRPDGNVGWIDPERTSKAFNGHGSVNGVAS